MTQTAQPRTFPACESGLGFAQWFACQAARFAQKPKRNRRGSPAPESAYLRRDIGLAERATAENPYRHWPSI